MYPTYAQNLGYSIEVLDSHPLYPNYQKLRLYKDDIGYSVVLYGYKNTSGSDPAGYIWWTTLLTEYDYEANYNSSTGEFSIDFDTPLDLETMYFLDPYVWEYTDNTYTDYYYITVGGGTDLLLSGDYPTGPVLNVDLDKTYNTIQAAIDDPLTLPGHVIEVQPGTYVEQLHITTENLTINGVGTDPVVIQSPATSPLSFTTSAANKPIVFVDGVSDFTLTNVTVDGNNLGNANDRFVGIGFWNAGGNLEDVDVINIMDNPFSGSQHGVGIYAFNNTPASDYSITLNQVDVTDYQKTGVVLYGNSANPNLTVDLDYVTTVGQGPNAINGQNGIQIHYATGTVDNCNVSDVYYTGAGWSATGLIISHTADLILTSNTITDSQVGINADGNTGLQLQSNVFSGDSDYGINDYDSTGSIINANVITGIPYGIWTPAAVITNNVITGSDYAILLDGGPGYTITGNQFTDNYAHVYNFLAEPDVNTLVGTNSYDNLIVIDQVIYGNATILYVDADKELLQAGETQTYSVYANYIEDLRGFTVQITVPVEDFITAPAGFALAPQFDSPLLITTAHTTTDWVFNVSGSKMGAVLGATGDDVLLFSFQTTASTVDAISGLPFSNTPNGVCISITDAELRDDQNPYNEIPWEADCFLVKIDGGLPTVEIVNILDYPDGMTLEVGAGGVIWPLLDLLYTDNYDLSTAMYVIYPFGGTVPDAPADFTLPVGTIDGLTTTLADWQLPATTPDGTYTLYLLVTDEAGNFYILDWDFIIDTVAPGALTWVTCRTTPNANISVDLAWTAVSGNAPAFVNVWALDYDAITSITTNPYPEYDPTDLIVAGTIVNDIAPYTMGPSALGWVKVARIPYAEALTLNTVNWTTMLRGYYYFTIYGEAANGQMSAAPEDPFYRESISYWPGDVPGFVDGEVTGDDINVLSLAWGSVDGGTAWNNLCDVGPSTDYARRSRPMPDNVIDIEDLMMFAMNYENTEYVYYPRTFPEAEPVTIALHAQTSGDRLTLSLELGGNTGFVKGLDIPIAYGNGLHFLGFETGEVWPEGSLLLHTNRDGVVTLSGATLGADPIVEGNGVIATLSFAITGANTGFALEHMTARGYDNSEIEVVNNPAGNVDNDDLINVVPEANFLGGNYPNPFNGTTTLQYGLKEAGSVKLSVYNTRGQLIRTLVNESKSAGTFQVNWNGRDASGQQVCAGVYFFRLETSEGVKTAKGLMIK